MFASCKKDRKPAPTEPPSGTGKEYDVKLVVNTQTGEIQTNGTKATNAIATTATAFPKGISVIHFYAFKSDGNVATGFLQDSSMAGFGTLSFKAPADSYRIFIIAGTTGMAYYRSFLSDYDSDIDVVKNPAWSLFRDVFYKKLTLDVGPNTPTQQDVTLERVVGKLTVKLLSKLPANAKKLVLTINQDRTSYYNAAGVVRKDTANLSTADVANAQYSRSVIIMNTTTPFQVQIAVLDAAGNVIADATASNVRVEKNRQTIISGNLNSSSSGTFSTSLNQAYDATVNVDL